MKFFQSAKCYNALKTFIAFLASVLCIITLWQFVALKINSSLILPDIKITLNALYKELHSTEFTKSLLHTFFRCILALLLSTIIGIFLGLLSSAFSFINNALKLPLWIIKATPLISIIILALFWFKTSSIPIFASFLLALPIIEGSIEQGIKSIDTTLIQTMRLYGFNFFNLWHYVKIPAIKPFFTQGIKAAYGLIWKACVAGEVIALPQHALGSLLYMHQVHLEIASVIALTIIIIFTGFLSEFLFTIIITSIMKVKNISFSKSLKYTIPNEKIQTLIIYKKDNSRSPLPPLPSFSVSYGGKEVLSNFKFTLNKNKITAIIAPSGAGKTTLLNEIAKFLFTQNVKVSYLQQSNYLLQQVSILENIMLPLQTCKEYSYSQAKNIALFFLKQIGLQEAIYKTPKELSGGERQRVSLIRAFSYPSDVLLMDEAFQSQDIFNEKELISLFCTLQKMQKKTVIFTTHNIREACVLADCVYIMKGSPLQIVNKTDTNARLDVAKDEYISPSFATLHLEQKLTQFILSQPV